MTKRCWRRGMHCPHALPILTLPCPALTLPPQIVPVPGLEEVPARQPGTEVPTSTPVPEFSPGVPSEMPDRGGSEISFPGH